MTFFSKLCLAPALILACCATIHASGTTDGKCRNSKVEITYLGVTTYFVRYWHKGQEVKLLLDDQIAQKHTNKAFNEVLGTNGKLDYVFVGHMHSDSTFPEVAASYAAQVMAPLAGCQRAKSGTNCMVASASAASPQLVQLADIGLQVTAIPQAHASGARGAPGASTGHDAFAYLFEFPGEEGSEKECASTFFWADTAHNRKPFLDGNYEKGDASKPLLNYLRLLKQGFSKLPGNVRTNLMAFPAHFMPNEAAWQEWAQVVRPLYHTNHHHLESLDLVPSPAAADEEAWISSASVPGSSGSSGGVPTASRGQSAYTPTFLPLEDFFITFRLQGPSVVEKVDLGYAAKFRASGTISV